MRHNLVVFEPTALPHGVILCHSYRTQLNLRNTSLHYFRITLCIVLFAGIFCVGAINFNYSLLDDDDFRSRVAWTSFSHRPSQQTFQIVPYMDYFLCFSTYWYLITNVINISCRNLSFPLHNKLIDTLSRSPSKYKHSKGSRPGVYSLRAQLNQIINKYLPKIISFLGGRGEKSLYCLVWTANRRKCIRGKFRQFHSFIASYLHDYRSFIKHILGGTKMPY